jgi:hypothetical protein
MKQPQEIQLNMALMIHGLFTKRLCARKIDVSSATITVIWEKADLLTVGLIARKYL